MGYPNESRNGTSYLISGILALLAAGSVAVVASSMNFNGLTSGTNTSAAMVVGSGASISATGSGAITATGLSATLGISGGGTGETSKTPAFDALSPLQVHGDILYYDGSRNDNMRLGIGTSGQALKVGTSGLPEWGTISTLPVTDTTSIAEGSSDATKEVRLEVDGLTTGTTRVVTVPDSNTTLPIASQVITLSGPTAARTYTLPDANATVLTDNAAVTVAQGGSGRATATAYAVICGGTSATGAHQSIASVGTAGQVLTSNGAGALPSFQAAGSASLPAADTTSIVEGSADNTKEIRFEVDGLTTGTVRVITPPDANITLAGQNYANTFTAQQILETGAAGGSPTIFRQTGGVAGTDEVQVTHDGTDGIITTKSGKLISLAPDATFSLRNSGSATTERFSFLQFATHVYFDLYGDDGVDHKSRTRLSSVNGGGLLLADVNMIKWSSDDESFGTADCGLKRAAAGVISTNDGTNNCWLQNTAGRAFLASAFTNDTTTMNNVTGLSVTLKAGRKYAFTAHIFVSNSTGTDGFVVDFDGGTATATTYRAFMDTIADGETTFLQTEMVTAIASDITYAEAANNDVVKITITGAIVVNAGGTFIPRAGMSVDTGGTLTVHIGSHIIVEDMP